MFIKKLDILSPPITLFYESSKSHSSVISGILTIIALIIIIIYFIFNIIPLFEREKQEPTVTSYYRFSKDVGTFSVNSSYLFHFLRKIKLDNLESNEGFDFTSFNIIGFDEYILGYESEVFNIYEHNHWLYGLCNNNDIKNMESLVNFEFFFESACIRKYYNKRDKKYYNTDEPGFKWPKIGKGSFNSDNEFYTFIVQKCEQNILNNIFNESYICKDKDEIDKIINTSSIDLYFIDNYIDVTQYKNCLVKYFNRVQLNLENNIFLINYFHFNINILKTQLGYIFDSIKEEKSYSFETYMEVTKFSRNKIVMQYFFWLDNKVN